jgi:hypothetical protein
MGLRDWLRALFTGAGADGEPLPSRHDRREAARLRHRATDAPLWPEEERHANPDQGREVQDIAPGIYGSGASRHWIGRRRGR